MDVMNIQKKLPHASSQLLQLIMNQANFIWALKSKVSNFLLQFVTMNVSSGTHSSNITREYNLCTSHHLWLIYKQTHKASAWFSPSIKSEGSFINTLIVIGLLAGDIYIMNRCVIKKVVLVCRIIIASLSLFAAAD